MSELPGVLVELMSRHFGLAAQPTYGKTLAIFDRDPYRDLRESLALSWEVEDSSDPQYDLGPQWWMIRPTGNLGLRLSYVGPYYLLLDEAYQMVQCQEIEELVAKAGFYLLEKEVLETPVRIWEPEVEGFAYEFLFEFDHGLPWG